VNPSGSTYVSLGAVAAIAVGAAAVAGFIGYFIGETSGKHKRLKRGKS
jgi:hypothetical protein